MDYNKECLKMMLHLGDNYTPENMTRLLACFGASIALTMAMIDDHKMMHEILAELLEATERDACQFHKDFHGHLKNSDRAKVDV